MKTFCWIALLALAGVVWGQPQIEWAYRYLELDNSYPVSVMLATDGGFFVTGTRFIHAGDTIRGYLMKVDSLGGHQWDRLIREEAQTWIDKGLQLANGDLILAGAGGGAMMVRCDSAGNEIWGHVWSGGSFRDACILSTGNIVGTGPGTYGRLVMWVTPDGDSIRAYDYPREDHRPSDGLSIIEMPDGSIVTVAIR